MVEPVARDYSQVASQVFLEGAQELLGRERLEHLSGCHANGNAIAFRDVRMLLDSLEEAYGVQGGHGLALRIGRAVFRHGLKELGGWAGFRDVQYRILPSPRRVEQGLQTLAKVVSDTLGSPVLVTDEGACWLWRMEGCPICPGCGAEASGYRPGDAVRGAEKSGCYLVVGLIQEFATWAAGGRFYRVSETECRAAGSPACVFRIEKKPLD